MAVKRQLVVVHVAFSKIDICDLFSGQKTGLLAYISFRLFN